MEMGREDSAVDDQAVDNLCSPNAEKITQIWNESDLVFDVALIYYA
jgi:hypothetical protein